MQPDLAPTLYDATEPTVVQLRLSAMSNKPTSPLLTRMGVFLQGKFRHIAIWLGVVGVIPLPYFLQQDMGWSSENIWRVVVLPLSICSAWSLAAIGWARHGSVQDGSSCPHCRYCLEGHQATVMRCPECGIELSAEPRRPMRLRLLPGVLVVLLTLGCIAGLLLVAFFLAFAECASC